MAWMLEKPRFEERLHRGLEATQHIRKRSVRRRCPMMAVERDHGSIAGIGFEHDLDSLAETLSRRPLVLEKERRAIDQSANDRQGRGFDQIVPFREIISDEGRCDAGMTGDILA